MRDLEELIQMYETFTIPNLKKLILKLSNNDELSAEEIKLVNYVRAEYGYELLKNK